jgi:nucleotide-binding universal stress UspA family protein
MKEVNKVIVALDGSSGAVGAARAAARLASAMEIPMVFLHVFPLRPYATIGAAAVSGEDIVAMADSVASGVFQEVVEALGDPTADPESVVLIGDPAEEILNYLDDREDLLMVMGRRGQSTLRALLLGSVSDKVLRHTRTPVTIVS